MTKSLPKMTNRIGQVVKGAPPSHRLTFKAQGESADTVINEGSLISLNADGKFVLGCGAGDGLNLPMPMLSGSDSSQNGVVLYGAQAVGGNYLGFVFTGGFEVETTEYVSGTYKPGDALTGATGNDLGKFKLATVKAYATKALETTVAEPIVGIVSTGIGNADNDGVVKVLRFWTVFIPANSNVVATA